MSTSKKNILITGASGLLGARLTELLTERGDHVAHLSRHKKSGSIETFVWDVEKQRIDPEAFNGIDAIIHLAGAGVADERWTTPRKREILESRTHSTQLLQRSLKGGAHQVKAFVSASAIGYYGFARNEILTEESSPGEDFLARVTRQWEEAVERLREVVPRVIRFRIGIVLSEHGGALKEMAMPVRYFVGAPLGSGNQQMSWIHIDDVCGMFMKAIDDTHLDGVYNAVAPNPITNRELTKAIGRSLHKPVFIPSVPGVVLRLILGEMADIVLKGSHVSCQKILEAGYKFKFTKVQDAVNDLIRSK